MLRILFTYPQAIPHETLLVNNLMKEDWDFLHVRKPDFDRDEMMNYLEVIPDLHHKIVLHSHYDLIKEYDLAGICLNRKALGTMTYEEELTSSCDIRPLTNRNGIISIFGVKPDLVAYSAHGFSEIQSLPFNTDYVFLSPIFDSISKKGYRSGFDDPQIISAFNRDTDRKVIALGGVNNDRMARCEELGFEGYAMLGHIWEKYFTFVETIQ